MMPRPLTVGDVVALADRFGRAEPRVYTGHGDPDPEVTTQAVETVVTPDYAGTGTIVWVPWQPDEIDLAALAQGGTLWLASWGGLPPHDLRVIRRGEAPT